MHLRRLAVLLLGLPACFAWPSENPEATKTYLHEAAGVWFPVPSSWQLVPAGSAWIFAGPKGGDTYYTTLTVQVVEAEPMPLTAVLDQTYAKVSTLPQFVWQARDLGWVDGQAALFFTVQFELHEQLRRQTGVLFARGPYVVSINYAAPETLFFAGLPAFTGLLEGLTLAQPRLEIAAGLGQHL